jgi:hypothetical protein
MSKPRVLPLVCSASAPGRVMTNLLDAYDALLADAGWPNTQRLTEDGSFFTVEGTRAELERALLLGRIAPAFSAVARAAMKACESETTLVPSFEILFALTHLATTLQREMGEEAP